MSIRHKPSSADGRLTEIFGATVESLYEQAASPGASPALRRALELRSMLAVTEVHAAYVRNHVHQAMAPDRDMDDLSADELRRVTRWLDAAIGARQRYRTALDTLLRVRPAPEQRPSSVRTTQAAPTTTPSPPPLGPAPRSAAAKGSGRVKASP